MLNILVYLNYYNSIPQLCTEKVVNYCVNTEQKPYKSQRKHHDCKMNYSKAIRSAQAQ
jgi:hypothetical protein